MTSAQLTRPLLALLVLLTLCLTSINSHSSDRALAQNLLTQSSLAAATEYGYNVVRSFPHDTDIYTQGLEYRDNYLFESGGQYGKSIILKRRLNNNRQKQYTALDGSIFAEGLTLIGDKVYQLSWKSQRGFIYDAQSLAALGEFSYRGEGWGLTNNGRQLIISDGSDQLQFIDPEDFTVSHRIKVSLAGKPVTRLNELEWIDGLIYANIWTSNLIVMIDPNSGKVVGYVNLEGLLPAQLTTARTDVLNGIAYDHQHQRLLVTGKYWPKLYHIELIDKSSTSHRIH